MEEEEEEEERVDLAENEYEQFCVNFSHVFF
jgi:hypothetical protein